MRKKEKKKEERGTQLFSQVTADPGHHRDLIHLQVVLGRLLLDVFGVCADLDILFLRPEERLQELAIKGHEPMILLLLHLIFNLDILLCMLEVHIVVMILNSDRDLQFCQEDRCRGSEEDHSNDDDHEGGGDNNGSGNPVNLHGKGKGDSPAKTLMHQRRKKGHVSTLAQKKKKAAETDRTHQPTTS